MDRDELRRRGVAAYGDDWREAMAADVGKHPSTIWRWDNDQAPIGASALAVRIHTDRRIAERGLRGRTILVVEDEALIALNLQAALVALGCAVVGPAMTLESALQLAQAEGLDAALLDVNLRGQFVFPAAEILMRRGVPVVFSSGYVSGLPAPLAGRPFVPKPAGEGELVLQLAAAMRAA